MAGYTPRQESTQSVSQTASFRAENPGGTPLRDGLPVGVTG